jgi:hypothetical protein
MNFFLILDSDVNKWNNISKKLEVSNVDATWRVNPTRHDLKINELDIDLIFLTRIGSDRVWVNPTRLIMFFEVILWFSTN